MTDGTDPTPETPSAPTFADKLIAVGIEGAIDVDGVHGSIAVEVPVVAFKAAASALKEKLGYNRFVDLSVVDRVAADGGEAVQRFEVYLLVYNMDDKTWVRLITRTASGLDSITDIYRAAYNYEREAFDLYGVQFAGHPSLTRILLPDGWEGHPMRRDAEMPVEPVDFTVTRDLYNT